MTQTTLDGSSAPVLAAGYYALAAGDTLHLLGNVDLTGTVLADGSSDGDPINTADVAGVVLDSQVVTLTGGGTVALQYAALVGGTAPGQTLVNAGVTLEGAGPIGFIAAYPVTTGGTFYPVSIMNLAGGVLDATEPTQPLFLPAAVIPLVNGGVIEATGGGVLEIVADTIDQTLGGTLLASGAGSRVELISGIVNGITVSETIHGGVIGAFGGGVISMSGIKLDGSGTAVTVAGGSTLDAFWGAFDPTTLAGAIDNLGSVVALPNTSGYSRIFFTLDSAAVTLDGSGTFFSASFQGATAAPSTLINVGNLLTGAGDIGYRYTAVALVNDAPGMIAGAGMGITATTFTNAGTLEALAGGVTVAGGVLQNTGIILASGGNLLFRGENVQTDAVTAAAGSAVEFYLGSGNTLTAPGGMLSIGPGTNFGAYDAGLLLDAATIDNQGTLFAKGLAGSGVTVTEAGLELIGGGSMPFHGAPLSATGTTVLDNVDNTISYAGIVGFASLTNGAGGRISGSVAVSDDVVNQGTLILSNLDAGSYGVGMVTNVGGLILMEGLGNLEASVEGGTIAATDGYFVQAGYNETLDGSAAPLTIAAGVKLRDYRIVYYGGIPVQVARYLALSGTVDMAGDIYGPRFSPVTGLVSSGLLEGDGTIAGTLDNTGVVLAEGGTFAVTADLLGAGHVAIAPGAVFALGGTSAETIDFGGAAGASLTLDAPTGFSGTLAGLAAGDTIDLAANAIAQASIVSGSTLAATLASGGTLDWAVADAAAGARAELVQSAAKPEVFDLTYVGVGTTNEPSYTAEGTGEITLDTGLGTSLSLADLVGFSFTIEVTSTADVGGLGPGTDTLELPDYAVFALSGSLGAGGTLAALSFVTGDAYPSNPTEYTVLQTLDVTNLGIGGAFMGDNASGTVTTQGSLTVGTPAPVLTEIAIACFAAGTRLATRRGMVAVETLRTGDWVATVSGGLRRVAWTGHRRVDPARHAKGVGAAPIHVARDAFGPGVPARDVLLSPDHAVLVDGRLVPVHLLANGATIAREDVAVTYWHVELDRHDVVLAEGLACESYLDTGNRSAFVETAGAIAMTPDFSRAAWAAGGCAALLEEGAEVAAMRERLLARAVALGWALRAEAWVWLEADGVAIAGREAGGWVRFAVPEGCRAAWLRSGAAVPHETRGAEERRRLGVAVAELRLDGFAVALDDVRLGQGWHAAEPLWRWTCGCAELRVAGARELSLRLALAEPAWREAKRMGSGA